MQIDISQLKDGPMVQIGGSLSKDVETVSDLQGIINLSQAIFDAVGDQWTKHIDRLNNASELLSHVRKYLATVYPITNPNELCGNLGAHWKLAIQHSMFPKERKTT